MKTAYFGGTFDPVHIGHIKIAESAVESLKLDALYFLPNFISPFKQDEKHSSSVDRLAMINLILHYNKAFRLEDYEVERAEVSYTYNTLLDLKRLKPEDDIYFIIGFDSLLTIDKWYRGEDILRNFKLIAFVRPGISDNEGERKLREYWEKYSSDISLINSVRVDASSTEIRKRVSQNKSLDGLVTPEVEEYIYEHNLYR